MKDLTNSAIDRQNILNNTDALATIQKSLGITGMLYEGEYRFTTAQVADYFQVSTKTIKRQIENFGDELTNNGYVVLKGKQLKEFKTQFGHLLYQDIEEEDSQRDTDVSLLKDTNDRDIDVPIIEKTSNSKTLRGLNKIGVFNFRALLNIGMLLTESEKAKSLRSTILDIVIDSLNQKFGGTTKYINQRTNEYLTAKAREPEYRKEFTSALSRYYCFREVTHEKLQPYIKSLSPEEYDNFLGDKSQHLLNRIIENPALLDVFKRLKDR